MSTTAEIQELCVFQDDPMMIQNYFHSPIITLLESTSTNDSGITLHDLTEAYTTLSNRIVHHSHRLRGHNSELPALTPFKTHRVKIFQILRRDIQHCLLDSTSSEHDRLPEDRNLSSSMVRCHRIGQEADAALLSHSALCFLSHIFMYDALHNIFTTRDLQDLLRDVLAISLALDLSSPNQAKAYNLIICILHEQNLPETVLLAKKDEIFLVISRALQRGLTEGSHGIAINGLKAAYTLLKQHYPFLLALASLLPAIIHYLTTESREIRLQAVIVLTYYAKAKITGSLPTTTAVNISRNIQLYIESQSAKRKANVSLPPLRAVISASLTTETPAHAGEGPVWALIVLASIIVLHDASLFFHPTSLKFLLPSLAESMAHQSAAVHSIHPHVWKCLMWSFSRIDSSYQNATDTRKRGFRILKQELRKGLGGVLVFAALDVTPRSTESLDGGPLTDIVLDCIAVVEEMISCDSKSTQLEAVGLLTRLLDSVGAASEVNALDRNSILTRALFDGTLLRASWEQLPLLVQELEDFNLECVRPLTEEEIVNHWESLVSVWIRAVELALQDLSLPTSGLIQSWHCLLLVQAQLTQGLEHLEMQLAFSNRAAEIIVYFLDLPGAASKSIADQKVFRLSLVEDLWMVLKQTVVAPCLVSPAEAILAAVLRLDLQSDIADVKTVWNRLCADLISRISNRFFNEVCSGNNLFLTSEGQHVWSVLAKHWSCTRDGRTWQDGVACLATPLRAWILSDPELELWGNVLDSTVALAEVDRIDPSQVVDQIVQSAVKGSAPQFLLTPEVAQRLLLYISTEGDELLPMMALAEVSKVLLASYPPETEQLPPILELLRHVRIFIKRCTSKTIVGVLEILQTGISAWVEDESEVFLDSDYNDVMMALYVDSLEVLRTAFPSNNFVDRLAPLLSSAFSRIPPPAIGPMAFEKFWRDTYHGSKNLSDTCPLRIRQCLKAFDDVFGGSLMAGLTTNAGSNSHQIRSSPVPDSQAESSDPYKRNPDQVRPTSPREDGQGPNPDGQIPPRFLRSEPGSVLKSDSPVHSASLDSALYVPEKRKSGNAHHVRKRRRANTNPDQKSMNDQKRPRESRPRHRMTSAPVTRECSPVLRHRWRSCPESRRPSFSGHIEALIYPNSTKQGRPSILSQPLAMPEDYDSWEVGLSVEELESFKDSFQDEAAQPD